MGTGDSLVGRALAGRFDVVGHVGVGGMGTIYRAIDRQGGGEVAVKVMSAELVHDEVFLKRFHREARTAERLTHRSTVRIFDHGVDGGRPFIVMELVAGADLHRVLEREGRLPELRAARIVAQVCSALAAAHDLGVVHRDLKPENIMVAPDRDDPRVERVKVLDFGIAKLMPPELCSPDGLPISSSSQPSSNPAELTRVGTLLGTPSYMAPEQLRGEDVDARTDLYACGLLLYQLLTDKIPLVADSFASTAALRRVSPPPRPSDLIPSTHDGLDDLIAAALAPDREARPASARQMQEQLVAMLPELEEDLLPARIAVAGGPARSPRLTRDAASSRRRGGRRGGRLVTLPPDSAAPSSNQDKFHDRASWLQALPAVMRGAKAPAVSTLDEAPTLVMAVHAAPQVIAVHVAPRPRSPAGPRWVLGAVLLALLFASVALLAYLLN